MPRFENWGRLPYEEAWNRQRELVERRARDEIEDLVVFVEHPDPVVTLGRGALREGGRERYVRRPDIPVFEIERGGLATYHGPGQLVVYPIFKLQGGPDSSFRGGIVRLIRTMEEWSIRWLKAQGLEAGRIEGKTGVWVPPASSAGFDPARAKKIASLGLAVRRWVSFHGMALNLSTGLTPWTWLDPCGFDSAVMTDLASLGVPLKERDEIIEEFMRLWPELGSDL